MGFVWRFASAWKKPTRSPWSGAEGIVDAASRALEPAQPTRKAFTPIVGYHHILQHPPQVLIGHEERVGVGGSRMRPSATDFDARKFLLIRSEIVTPLLDTFLQVGVGVFGWRYDKL